MTKAINPNTPPAASANAPEFTARQKAFIQHYSMCRNGSESARLAGYSVPSANRIASRLLANVHIREAVNRQLDWSFEEWCTSVKGIFHNEDQWQAKVKSLELYGKAKGWLREQAQTDTASGILDKITKMMQVYNQRYTSQVIDTVDVTASEPVRSEAHNEISVKCEGAPAGGCI